MSSEKLDFVAGPAGIAVGAMDVYWANLQAWSHPKPAAPGILLKSGDRQINK